MEKIETLEGLVNALKCLPGVGPKSALRMAYHLLQRDRSGAHRLSESIANALELLGHCKLCNNFSETPTCGICESQKRDSKILCVVEMPTDLLMLEQTHSYKGMYFVLMGRLSPLDGIGPKDIHLGKLIQRLKDSNIDEVILATNFTVEGNATAQYIQELLKDSTIKLSRIARGLPMGGEIEYVDSGTLAQAIVERKTL
ncbi:MAG: recombination mediator RecR [Proteobacteria bacterium]|jgi:recombination protein RecR|nr:recombination mediator RecR [Pseudomonadota bacterium]HCK04202.1 recombination protein RecR [Methylophilaceae bacterium]|tara:strand:+ start:766 stop:1362 length:597 start_codon:yes stop_codon:yes gene_type:complete